MRLSHWSRSADPSEALREIKKHYEAVNDTEQQCEDAKTMLEMSRRRRQKVKEMLTSCSEKNLDSLERRVRNLNVADFNEAVSMTSIGFHNASDASL